MKKNLISLAVAASVLGGAAAQAGSTSIPTKRASIAVPVLQRGQRQCD